ncbi:MAG: TM0106 family RecB-like putative nuclease [Thermoanaerobaculia bacterium]
MPEPDPADVFFDFEGDPFAGPDGLEYLWGWVTVEEGEPRYHHAWSFDEAAERRAFADFVGAMTERLKEHPGFHVYHYGHYETSTLKRLMGRHGVCENEVDALLRAEVFVDLHRVTTQALRAAVESYTLKDLERLTGLAREVDLREAGRARGRLERMLELGEPELADAALLDRVRGYNEDDCVSTLRLRDWLEQRRAELVEGGEEVPRFVHEEEEPSDEATEKQRELVEIIEALTRDVPVDPDDRSPEQGARWLLAHLLDYYWREEKASWWEFHRRRELSEEELFEDPGGIRGLELLGTVPAKGWVPVHRYGFPEQPVRVRRKSELYVGERKIGTVVDLDRRARTLDVKKTGDTADEHPSAVFVHDIVRPRPKDVALLELGRRVVAGGLYSEGAGRLALDLLLRRPPRLSGALADPAKPALEEARRLALALDRTALPVQGPPGSGKTYTGARMALDLVRRGARVGVTATSHKVMLNFLAKTLEAAAEAGVEVQGPPPVGPDGRGLEIREIAQYPPGPRRFRVGRGPGAGRHPVALGARGPPRFRRRPPSSTKRARTSWRTCCVKAPAAKSMVLLGDPQQPEQPQQGSHPEGTHVSASAAPAGRGGHAFDGEWAVPGETWRFHPELCAFTSELFYDRWLHPVPGLERQVSRRSGALGGWVARPAGRARGQPVLQPRRGLRRWPGPVEGLTDGTTTWTDRDGAERPVGLEETLVVAPYNDQVDAARAPASRARAAPSTSSRARRRRW